MFEAKYYTVLKDNTIQCNLCPHQCRIALGRTGICGVRKNENGKLYNLIYNKFTSLNLDPIEKKPLYHFYPRTEIFSLGTIGCNFRCPFCQNYEISQAKFDEVPLREVSIDDVIRLAKQYNSIGIAYTYNEPLINYEWIISCSQEAHKAGLKNVLVTNSYLNEEPWENLLKYIDAANIDVKSFRDDFYKNICGARIGPVLRNVEIMFKRKKHVEVTTLLIPKHNDSVAELTDLVDWLSSLDAEIPLHFSRYFPHYKFTIEPTPLKTLELARSIAMKKLKYVYIGNVWELEYNRTYCPECKAVLIERKGYNTEIVDLQESHCKKCATKVNIVM